jgi:hypothetical protein
MGCFFTAFGKFPFPPPLKPLYFEKNHVARDTGQATLLVGKKKADTYEVSASKSLRRSAE